MNPRRWLADGLMSAACALIGWAEWLDPAPMLPGADERVRQRVMAELDKTGCDG